jgi:hypothetical protein
MSELFNSIKKHTSKSRETIPLKRKSHTLFSKNVPLKGRQILVRLPWYKKRNFANAVSIALVIM